MRLNKLTDEQLKISLAVEMPAAIWLAVYGNVCLGLRHPLNIAASQANAEVFLGALENIFVQTGMMDQEDLDLSHKRERAGTDGDTDFGLRFRGVRG